MFFCQPRGLVLQNRSSGFHAGFGIPGACFRIDPRCFSAGGLGSFRTSPNDPHPLTRDGRPRTTGRPRFTFTA